jgi:plastocyanin domain-containing protein
MPINWVVTGTAPYSCSMALRSADMGVQTNLNEGENIIKVNALQPGNASFACVMGMYSGNFTVVEKPVAPAPATSQGSKS